MRRKRSRKRRLGRDDVDGIHVGNQAAHAVRARTECACEFFRVAVGYMVSPLGPQKAMNAEQNTPDEAGHKRGFRNNR